MPGSVNLHLCVDMLIGTSHEAHYRLLIVFALSPFGLQPGRPGGYLYRLQRNQRIPALCVILSHLNDDKFLCQMVGLGSPTQAPV